MTASDIIATCSVAVATLAFVATAYQAWVARHHNRLSVRPHLVWHIARKNSLAGAGIIYSVKNLGLGPAIVTERYFTKDDIRFVPPGLQTDEVSDFLKYVIGQKFNYKLNTFGLPGKGSAIPAQGEVVIADVDFPGQSLSQVAVNEEIAGKIAFHLTYKSLYDEALELHAE
ncbi:hypothetical protein V4F39_09735 [Aquincola sp. MAHUQ-54]|uniref:Uncharacterized protein n=1 Tax=Aquincola agrisoli TaxID=3119538 RepID=A0AAW9QFN1_9BURK